MGTNFYLRRKPLIDDVNKLKGYIDTWNIPAINELTKILYGKFSEYNYECKNVIHLGKRSAGWQFLWNPNVYIKDNGHYDKEEHKWISKPELVKFYDLNKKGITDFLKEECEKGAIIVSEYYNDDIKNTDEVYNVEDFLEMAMNWTGYTSETYRYDHPEDKSFVFTSTEWNKKFGQFGLSTDDIYDSDFIRDGLRFATTIEFS